VFAKLSNKLKKCKRNLDNKIKIKIKKKKKKKKKIRIIIRKKRKENP